jgi:hypothetical protein
MGEVAADRPELHAFLSGGAVLFRRADSPPFSATRAPMGASEPPAQENQAEDEVDYVLHVRLEIDPRQAEARDDVFRLIGDDGAYTQTKTIRDDQIPGDDYVDLKFDSLIRGLRYSLEVNPGAEGEPYLAFENLSWGQLLPVIRHS